MDVLVADPSPFVRRLLREVLAADHRVVAEAENGVELIERHDEADPDVVVTEASMPIRDGIDAVAELTDADPATAVVFCAAAGDGETIRRAREAGASEYVVKPFKGAAVLAAIADAVAG